MTAMTAILHGTALLNRTLVADAVIPVRGGRIAAVGAASFQPAFHDITFKPFP